MHAGDHDVEAFEQFVFLIEGAVVENVDLDAGENAHRCDRVTDLVDHVELLAQPLG